MSCMSVRSAMLTDRIPSAESINLSTAECIGTKFSIRDQKSVFQTSPSVLQNPICYSQPVGTHIVLHGAHMLPSTVLEAAFTDHKTPVKRGLAWKAEDYPTATEGELVLLWHPMVAACMRLFRGKKPVSTVQTMAATAGCWRMGILA